jgi:WD40 repeat protein
MSLLRRPWPLVFCLLLSPAARAADEQRGRPAPAPGADRLESLWADLAAADAAKAYQAILAMTAAPKDSVPFLKTRLRPVPAPDPQKLAHLLKNLRSERFAAREKAMTELARLGELAEPALRKAAGEGAPLEFRRRVEQLLDKLQGTITQPEQLRALRAIEVLEHVGTGAARDVLRKLATGAPGSRVTQEAKSSIQRLERRAVPPATPAGPQARTDLYGDPLPAGALARLGTMRLRHNSYFATATVLTPDGKTILTASPDGTALHYWRTADGQPLRTIQDKESLFAFLSLSADGKVLASGGRVQVGPRDCQGQLRLWDVASGRVLHALAYPFAASPDSVTLCPDGKTVITADSDGVLRAWDVPAGKEVRRLQLAQGRGFSALALSADGALVAAAQQDDKSIYLWTWRTVAAARKLKLPPGGSRSTPMCLALSPDGKTLASAGDFHGGVYVWDIARGRVLRTLLTGDARVDYAHAAQFSRDGKQLASAGGDAVRNAVVLWDTASGKLLRQLELGPEMAKHLAFSADGRLLAAAAGSGVRLWRTDTGEAVAECHDAHRSLIWALAVSPRGDQVASASFDGTVRLWEAATGKQRRVFRHGAAALAVTFSPDGRLLASSAQDSTVRLWNATTGREIFKLIGQVGYGGRCALCFRPDGKALVFWGDYQYLRVWDVANGKAVVEHRPHPAGLHLPDDEDSFPQKGIGSLQGVLTPDGRVCLVASPDKLAAFDVTTGKALKSLPTGANGRSPVVSPDGRLALVHDRGQRPSLSIWDLGSGKLLRTLSPDSHWAEVAFSPDGRMVAVAGGVPERHIELWELSTGQRRLTIGGVSAGHAVAFSPDGRLLVTGMMDTTALVWDLARLRK